MKYIINKNEIIDIINNNIKFESNIIDSELIANKVFSMIYDEITPDEIDNLIAEICINMSTLHPDYSYLAGNILVFNLHNKTLNNFSSKMELLLNQLDTNWLQWILSNSDELNNIIDYQRDYNYDYFGFKTLEKAYLLKIGNKIIERPQDMILRTAITLQMGNLELIKKTYDYMSLGYYTHATPTLFNSGTKHMQLSSCFIEDTEVITMNGIKKIQNVIIDDEIVTHTGCIKKILQVHKNPLNDRKIMLLKVHNTKEIYVTDNHKFWSISNKDYIPKWRSINELTNNDFIAIPSYQGNKNKIKNYNIDLYYNDFIFNDFNINDYNINTERFNNYYINDFNNKITTINHMITIIKYNLSNYIFNDNNLNIDNNIAKLFGLYLNCGEIMTNFCGIKFSIPKKNMEVIKFISDTLTSYFFLDIVIYNNINYEIYCYSYIIGQLFNKIFDDKNNNNIYINMINWTNDLLYSFIIGLNLTNIKNFMTNKNIINQLYHIFRLHGIDYSDYNQSSIEYLKNLYYNNKKEINNITYLRILSIDETLLNHDNVYTLGVEDDHSYNVEGLICENCFLLGTNDNLSDICKSWSSSSQISKWAGGIGIHLSNIRSKNSIIKGTNGKSSGLVPLLKIYNDIARWIDQGGKRPGSIAVYLEPHHPDIFEFIELRKNFGSENDRARDLFLALWVSDLFMKHVNEDKDWLNNVYGDEFENLYFKYVSEKKYRDVIKARKLWMHILDAQIETGLPYICYKDSINKKNNQKNLGTIKSSNLCVHESTKILTDKGYYPIGLLKDLKVKIWNGDQWSDVTIKQTGSNINLIRVKLSNGVHIDCTREHKFYIQHDDTILEIQASELKLGYQLIKFNLPEIIYDDPIEFKYPYTHGYFCGEGITYANCLHEITNYSKIYLHKSKKDLLQYITFESYTENENTDNIDIILPKDLNIKFDIPFLGSIDDRLRWFEGLCDANGHIIHQGLYDMLQVNSINKYFLLDIRLMLHTLGIDSKVIIKENDNNLLILPYEVYKLLKIGFQPKTLIITNNEPTINKMPFVKVISIEESYKNVDTYCFTEPLKHIGIFNGVACGNCAEIVQYSDNDEYSVCNLASIALKSCINPFDNNINNKWIIYTKENCKYCVYAKKYLQSINIIYTELEYNDENIIKLKKLIDKNITYPQIFILNNDKLKNIGGWSELYQYTAGTYNYDKLYDIAYLSTINLNQVIDINYYPVPETKKSNMSHRPIGLGIQGLADTLVSLRIAYDSEEAIEMNSKIMETIYLASMTATNDIAIERESKMIELKKIMIDIPEYYDSKYDINNKLYHELKPTNNEFKNNKLGSYTSFEGSLYSEGKFQFDMWDYKSLIYKDRWDALRIKVMKYGTRNSLLTALMPTASTSQILGNNECFEFFTNNIYTRKTNAGDFILVNKYLINDLCKLNLWSINLKDKIIAANGSIQHILEIPDEIKKIYKTIWEIKQIWVLKGALARAPFVDQSQSMNIFMANPDYQRLSSSHFWGWKNGLKTGMYYLRTRPSADAIKFTIDPNLIKNSNICENCSA